MLLFFFLTSFLFFFFIIFFYSNAPCSHSTEASSPQLALIPLIHFLGQGLQTQVNPFFQRLFSVVCSKVYRSCLEIAFFRHMPGLSFSLTLSLFFFWSGSVFLQP